MTYEDWLKTAPEDLKLDALWQFKVYPKTLFLYDLLTPLPKWLQPSSPAAFASSDSRRGRRFEQFFQRTHLLWADCVRLMKYARGAAAYQKRQPKRKP